MTNLKPKQYLTESVQYPGYFHFPGDEQTVISEAGHVIDILLNCCMLVKSYGLNRYPSVYIHSLRQRVDMHRLLGRTFLYYLQETGDEDYSELIINHKDGDKNNYQLHNLEWLTMSGNIIHAYTTGLRTDQTPVDIKDLDTDEVERVYSLSEAARVLGSDNCNVHKYLNGDKKAPFMKKYVLRYKQQDWPQLTKADIGKFRHGAPKEVIVTDILIGKKYIFSSIGAAAHHFNAKQGAFNFAVLNGGITKKRFKVDFLHLFEDETVNCERIDLKLYGRSRNKRKQIPIMVTNLVTRKREFFISSSQFAMLHNVKKNSMQKAMYLNNGIWRHFHIEYINKSV